MPGRRSFLIACGSLVAAPAFGNFGGRSETEVLPELLPAGTGSVGASGQPPARQDLALHIAGWDLPADSEQCAAAPTISINSSWQATWR